MDVEPVLGGRTSGPHGLTAAEQVDYDSSGNVVSRSVKHYTDEGRLRASNELMA